MLNRRQFAIASGAAAFGWPSLSLAEALASSKVLCGFPAGGTTDAVSRRVAEKLQGGGYAKVELVDNKPGAGGRLAVDELKRSPADGSVLLLTPASMITLVSAPLQQAHVPHRGRDAGVHRLPAGVRLRRRPGGARVGEEPEGLPRLGQGQPGHRQLRLARRRHRRRT